MKLVGDMGGFPRSGIPVRVLLTAEDLAVYNRVDYLIAAAANASVTFTHTPVVSQGTPLKIFKNGSLLFYGVDYTVSANVATFSSTLTVGDKICSDYWATAMQRASTLTGIRTFATFNPSDIGGNLVLSGGNLTLTTDGTADSVARLCRTTLAFVAGQKYYWESRLTSSNPEAVTCGVADAAQALGGGGTQHFLGEGSDSVGGPYSTDGNCYFGNSVVYAAGTVATGSYVAHSWDGTTSTYAISLDGTTYHDVHTLSGTPVYVAGEVGRTSASLTLNLGASAFHFTPRSGFRLGVYVDT